MYIYIYISYIYRCFFIRSPVHMKMGPPIGWSYWRLFSIWMGDGFFSCQCFTFRWDFVVDDRHPFGLFGYVWELATLKALWFIMIHQIIHHDSSSFWDTPHGFHDFSCTFDHFAHEKMVPIHCRGADQGEGRRMSAAQVSFGVRVTFWGPWVRHERKILVVWNIFSWLIYG